VVGYANDVTTYCAPGPPPRLAR